MMISSPPRRWINRLSYGLSYGRPGASFVYFFRLRCSHDLPDEFRDYKRHNNRLTGSPYAYDANGNMTNDGQNTLVYDAENHAVSATNGSSSGTYTYDSNGFRVQKVSGSNTTIYIFSGSKVIAEYVNGASPSSPTREYLYSGATLLAKVESGATKYYHQNHLSNRLVTDSTGATGEQIGQFPFGESWYNASADKLTFTSYARDSESGNDYAMARYYISRLGRFSSLDPLPGNITDPQSLNRYSYGRNETTGLVDPSGLGPCDNIETRNRRKLRTFEIAGMALPIRPLNWTPSPHNGQMTAPAT